MRRLRELWTRVTLLTSPPKSVLAFMVVLCAVLIVVRCPERLLRPRFYAEDGVIFFAQAWEQGFLSALTEPYAGYMQIVARIVAGLALLVPLLHAPLVFYLGALFCMLVPILYLLGDRMRSQIPSFAERAIGAVLLAALPASGETYVNITNAHWYLTIAICFLLVSDPPVSTWQLVADTALVGLYALSFPLAVVFLPFAALRVRRNVSMAGRAWSFAPWVALCSGFALQVAVHVASPRRAGFLAVSYGAFEIVKEIVMHGFFSAILGVNANDRYLPSIGPVLYWLGLAAMILIVIAVIRNRSRTGLVLLYAAVAVFVLEHASPLHPGSRRDIPIANLRYYTVLVYFVLFAAWHSAIRPGYLRFAGAVILVCAVVIGIPGDFVWPVDADLHYPDQVAVFESLVAGTSFAFPIDPPRFPPMVLRRKPGEPKPSPLEGLRALPGSAPASVRETFLQGLDNLPYLEVQGTAHDPLANADPGGVYVVVDGRLFPAVTGRSGKAGRVPFRRQIPLSEIGPAGRHDLALIVLGHDRHSHYLPSAAKSFTVAP